MMFLCMHRLVDGHKCTEETCYHLLQFEEHLTKLHSHSQRDHWGFSKLSWKENHFQRYFEGTKTTTASVF